MSEWISVKDKLPDDEKLKVAKYAEVQKGKKDRHLGMCLTRFYLPRECLPRKVWCFEYLSTQPTKITHWASLPED